MNESKTKYMKIMRNLMGDSSDLRVEGMVLKRLLTLNI
jgi:hypothetical protein